MKSESCLALLLASSLAAAVSGEQLSVGTENTMAALEEVETTAHSIRSTPFERQNLRQRRELVGQAASTLGDAYEEFKNVDVGGIQHFKRAREHTKGFLEKGIQEIENVIELMEKVEVGVLEDPKIDPKSRRRLQGNYERPGGYRTQTSQKPHARYNAFFDGHPMASKMHKKFSQGHDAILNGNHNHVHSTMRQHQKKANHFQPVDKAEEHGRRMKESSTQVDPLEHAKGRQCQILTDCVSKMGLYDVFMYYFSDDIDPKGGTVDSTVIKFDEENLVEKLQNVTALAKKLHQRNEKAQDPLLAYGTDSECDSLLQFFHRNVEEGDVPKWEGATVSQVCLAQGSGIFVGLGDIAEAVGEKIAGAIAEEQMNCAWDLYRSNNRTKDERYKKEPFVFADEKQHRGTNDRLSIRDLIIPVALNNGVRDRHGKVLTDDERNSDKRFYTYEAYNPPDTRGMPPKEKKEAIRDHFKEVQDGFDLVFGEKQSVGFVCGVKEGMLKNDQPIPGHCCLDAPYENTGDEWGRKHECGTECQHPGPFLAGISEEACASHGGTWCQSPTNCQVLQECVDSNLKAANANGQFPYATYLKGGIIKNPTDAYDCGRSLEYFGFDETYNNYRDVCENIEQLQNTRNFKDLDEFFNQGSKGGGGGDNAAIPEADIKKKTFHGKLKEPKRDRSGTDPIAQGSAWDTTNFALGQALAGVDRYFSVLNDFECPDDGWGITWTVCSTFKNVINVIYHILLGLLEAALEISEFTYAELCEPSAVDHFEIYENTDAVFQNMEVTFEYLDFIYDELTGNQKEIAKTNADAAEILNGRLERVEETLSYIVEKLDSLPAPKVTHRPTPMPTSRPTPSPTLAPGTTQSPSEAPSLAPSVEEFCDHIVDLANIVDSDWYIDSWGCTESNPCIVKVDTDETLWIGAKGSSTGPDSSFADENFFKTSSKADTRKFLCGEQFNAQWSDGSDAQLQLVDGIIENLDSGDKISRCTALYDLSDIEASNWVQHEWGCTEGHPCIQTKLDEQGRLWLGNPEGHSGFGPGQIFGKYKYLHTTSEAETHKFLCGRHATALISSDNPTEHGYDGNTTANGLREEEIQMLDMDTISHGSLKMTRACTPIYTLGDLVDSDWSIFNWGCNTEHPCTVQEGSDGILWIGRPGGVGFGPSGADYSRWRFFKSSTPADTRKLLCGLDADFDRAYDINYIVVENGKVRGSFPLLEGAKADLRTVEAGDRFIVQVLDGKVVTDPNKIDGIEQTETNGFNKRFGKSVPVGVAAAEAYLRNNVHPRFVVVNDDKVKGTFARLDDAKDKLEQVEYGSRLIAEIKDGQVVRDPHKIDGKKQGSVKYTNIALADISKAQKGTPGYDLIAHHNKIIRDVMKGSEVKTSDFNARWDGWHDIGKMMDVAASHMATQLEHLQTRRVKMDGSNKLREVVTRDGKESWGFTFERMCEPIYTLDDITKFQWEWRHWKDGTALTARVAVDGTLWVGIPGAGYGPDKFYGSLFVWNTETADDTRKLLCGEEAKISFDNGRERHTGQMLNGNKIRLSRKGGQYWTRTSKEAVVPEFRLFGPSETKEVSIWPLAVGFCKRRGLELASYDDYCSENGHVYGGQKKSVEWAPISDDLFGYVYIGVDTDHSKACQTYKDTVEDDQSPAPWWSVAPPKYQWESNYILCKRPALQMFGPADGTAVVRNYEDSIKFCESKEMTLAKLTDICEYGQAFGGQKQGDQWVPYAGYANGWVEIGTSHRLCDVHHVKFGDTPKWGTDNEKEEWEANYVVCAEE